jgi:hypothetical protein
MVNRGLTASAVDRESTVEKIVAVRPPILAGSSPLNPAKQVCRALSRTMQLPFANHAALMPDKEHAIKLPDHIRCGRVEVSAENSKTWDLETEYPDLQAVFLFWTGQLQLDM